MDAFALPVCVKDDATELVDAFLIVAEFTEPAFTAQPAVVDTKTDPESFCLHVVAAHSGADLAAHMLKIGEQYFPVAGIGWHDFAMADGFWCSNIGMQEIGIRTLAHIPDTPTEVAETP